MAILRLMPYLLPTALLFGVPAALLFAVTTSFGRMSAAGEIIALKALGIGPSVVLMPIGVLAVLLSLVTFWLNDIAFSWGEIGIAAGRRRCVRGDRLQRAAEEAFVFIAVIFASWCKVSKITG